MEKFSVTPVTKLLLFFAFCQQKALAWDALCPSAVELIVSLKQNDSYEILPHADSYAISNGDEFVLECVSRFPVELKFDGFLPNLPTSSSSSRIIDSGNTSCHQVQIASSVIKSATGRYNCVDSGRNGKSVYIFANGTKPPYLLNPGRGRSIYGSVSGNRAFVPCISTNDSVVVHLSKNGKNSTSFEGLSYDPKEGFSFKVSNPVEAYGNYTCIVSDYDDPENVLVKILPPTNQDTIKDEITLEVIGNEIRCDGASSLTFFRCNSPVECEFFRNCETRPTTKGCNRMEGQDCSHSNYSNSNCQSIVKNQGDALGGLVICSNTDRTVTKRFNIATDFEDKVESINLTTVQPAAFMHFIPVEFNTWMNVDKFWQEEIHTFRCNASKSIFSQGIQWKFELVDGTEKLATVLNETNGIGTTDYSITSLIKFDDTRIRKIICSAPRIDSDEWGTLSQSIIVKESYPPKIENESNETVIVPRDEENAVLNCSATALPIPLITWTKLDDESDSITPTHIEFIGSTSNSILDVSKASGPGTYICNASNLRGTKFKRYEVSFELGEPPSPIDEPSLVIIASLVLVLVFASTGLVYLYFKKKPDSPEFKPFPEEYLDQFFNGKPEPTIKSENINPGDDDGSDVGGPYDYLPYPADNEIKNPNENLITGDEVGRGQFGVTYKGKLKMNGSEVDVAIKVPKPGVSDAAFYDFLKELKIMSYVGNHQNVVSFLGSVTKDSRRREAKIVLEYCSNKDLKAFLKKEKRLFKNQFSCSDHTTVDMTPTLLPNYTAMPIVQSTTTSDLINWSYQIACGMEHLEKQKIVHRDLAARNIIVDGQRVAKVADFGLSRDIFVKDYYRLVELEGKQLPLKWFAPECMSNSAKFSTDSDIWAFGITMWEIFTLGDCPYPDLLLDPNNASNEFRRLLEGGMRMEKPQFANDALYEIMKSCWQQNGPDRPRFSELKESLFNVGKTLAFDLAQPRPVQPVLNYVGLSTSDFSLSDDENYELDGEIFEIGESGEDSN